MYFLKIVEALCCLQKFIGALTEKLASQYGLTVQMPCHERAGNQKLISYNYASVSDRNCPLIFLFELSSNKIMHNKKMRVIR